MAALQRDDPGLYVVPTEKQKTIPPEAILHDSVTPDSPVIYQVNPHRFTKKRICGIRRKLFITLVAIAIILAVIIGGTVGGILSRSKKENSHSSNEADTSTQPPKTGPSRTIAPSPSSTNLPLSEPVRQISACECNTTIFVSHQDEHGDLYMRAFYRKPNIWGNALKLNTTIAPISNTPLASVCWTSGGDYFELRISYVATDKQSTQITAKCPKDCSPCYNFSYTQGSNVEWKVYPGLAVTSTGPDELVMLALDDDGTILQRAYTPETGSLPFAAAQGLPRAHKNSPLAVDISKGKLNLFWFDENFALQSSTSTSGGTSWTKAEALPVTNPSKLPGAVGVAVSEDPAVTQVFFLGEDDMRTVVNRNGRWEQGYFEASFLNSTIGFGPVAAVGWDKASVRVYFVSGGQITELANEGFGNWERGSMPPYLF